ncbi:MAG: M48 family metallopeptidase [Verrucomicrobiales bacterium]|nr:M48 family metallopeptidase [Verrucomicrobiales bacterium]
MQINGWFFFIVIALVILWKVDYFTTLLNLKSLSPEVPKGFEDTFDAETYEQSQEYTRSRAVFGVAESVFSLVLFFVFWWLGGFGWLDSWVRGFNQGPIMSGLIFIGVLYVAFSLVTMPFQIYSIFGIEEKFGFNKMSFGLYLADQAKGYLLAAVIGLPILALILWIFQAVPHAWLWGWGATTAFSLLLAYVAPTLILPLFNKFEPLEDGELKSEIHAMAEKCDYPLKEVTQMDGSKRSTKSNAFFTGFGNNKRIALFDTLIAKHTVPELVAVLAHEIGHFKKRHIVKGMVISILTTGVLFFLLGRMMENRSLFDAFGVEQTSVYVSLVLFGILMQPFGQILGVAGNALSRKHEFEADAYAAKVTGEPDAMISALKTLSKDNLSNLTPHPAYVFLNYTHPPVPERIAALRGTAP